MHRLTRHLPGPLVALAALALTAGVVFAARPVSIEAPAAAAADGLTIATAASGKTVPVQAEERAAPDADEDAPEVDEDAPETQEPAEKPTSGTAERKQNHGWFVSQAAKGPTPESSTHGAAVSEVARSDAGKPDAVTAASAKGAAAAAAAKAKAAKAKSH